MLKLLKQICGIGNKQAMDSHGLIHMMGKNKLGVMVDVLGYHEDGEWVALALDMDLRGFGSSFEESLEDLMDHVRMQISFAIQKGDMDLVYHPADRKYFDMYDAAKKEELEQLIKEKPTKPRYRATGLPISKNDFNKACYV